MNEERIQGLLDELYEEVELMNQSGDKETIKKVLEFVNGVLGRRRMESLRDGSTTFIPPLPSGPENTQLWERAPGSSVSKVRGSVPNGGPTGRAFRYGLSEVMPSVRDLPPGLGIHNWTGKGSGAGSSAVGWGAGSGAWPVFGSGMSDRYHTAMMRNP